MEKSFLADQPGDEDGISWLGDGSRGAPSKWPFLSMSVGEVIRVAEQASFASARAAVMYAKKNKGLSIRTKVKNGILYVKRFA